MAERCGLFVIIALGESVLVTGATFAGLSWTAEHIGAFLVAFAGSVAMWVIYFNIGAERSSRLIASSNDPGRLARNGYTYLHILIVAGIIVAAVGDELALHHPERPQRDRNRGGADRRARALSARQYAVQAPFGAQHAVVASGRACDCWRC